LESAAITLSMLKILIDLFLFIIMPDIIKIEKSDFFDNIVWAINIDSDLMTLVSAHI